MGLNDANTPAGNPVTVKCTKSVNAIEFVIVMTSLKLGVLFSCVILEYCDERLKLGKD